MALCCAGRDCLLPPPPTHTPLIPTPISPTPIYRRTGRRGWCRGRGCQKAKCDQERAGLAAFIVPWCDKLADSGGRSKRVVGDVYGVASSLFMAPSPTAAAAGLSSPRVAHSDTKSEWSSLYFMLHNSSSGLGSASAISLNMDILRKLTGRYRYVLVV